MLERIRGLIIYVWDVVCVIAIVIWLITMLLNNVFAITIAAIFVIFFAFIEGMSTYSQISRKQLAGLMTIVTVVTGVFIVF